jgi:GT2 family glycosyltransferase
LVEQQVAVVAVTFNSAHLLADFFDSLDDGLRGLEWHLTIADNDSSDDTVQTVHRLRPEVKVVETGSNRGYAAGINAAVAAGGPHTAVLVLNPDVRLSAGCVGELMHALRQPHTGIAVPRLVDGSGALVHSMRREPAVSRLLADAVLGAENAGRLGRIGEVVSDDLSYESAAVSDWAEGSTMLISRSCWEAVGSWDESFFLYSEETDFALRARDAGFVTRYVPDAHARHLGGESTVTPGLWALVVTNKVRLYSRRAPRGRARVFYGVMVAREASRAVLGRQRSRVALRALLRMREGDVLGPEWLARQH